MIEGQPGVMVFNPGTIESPKTITITSPEQLAFSGIYVHPNQIERTWGREGLSSYKEADIAVKAGRLIERVAERRRFLTFGDHVGGMVLGFIADLSSRANGHTRGMLETARGQSETERATTAAEMLRLMVMEGDVEARKYAVLRAGDMRTVLGEKTAKERRYLV